MRCAGLGAVLYLLKFQDCANRDSQIVGLSAVAVLYLCGEMNERSRLA
jgi:hypothetical protein